MCVCDAYVIYKLKKEMGEFNVAVIIIFKLVITFFLFLLLVFFSFPTSYKTNFRAFCYLICYVFFPNIDEIFFLLNNDVITFFFNGEEKIFIFKN